MIDLNKKTMAENITRTVIPSLPFDMFIKSDDDIINQKKNKKNINQKNHDYVEVREDDDCLRMLKNLSSIEDTL
ncbi:hypothetical protein DERP_001485 [Dermatophagoides pteronyssinus]|uniref:Uncharacterized protein n=1 Tax=Dermatophagoides pteronyssinus TaxID=6956 RepID=A0ABQ8JEK9_DERPT|nr:hypothetical protein DERP_001485 [Dermatophagoides pteronyssinus]